jgi:hypothetical protein
MNRRLLPGIAVALGLLPIWADPALAGRRIALVIGNFAYQYAPAILNPQKDSEAMAAKFREAGFDVVRPRHNMGSLQFEQELRLFENEAADSDIAVIYYSGHGMDIGGSYYLIPTDARLASDWDVQDDAIRLDRFAESVKGAKRLRLVILDTCRGNPFARIVNKKSTSVPQEVDSELVEIAQNTDTLIAYPAQADSVAEDCYDERSPFTTALRRYLFVPGLDIRFAFARARQEVLNKTDKRQVPRVYGRLQRANVIGLVPPHGRPAVDLEGEKIDYSIIGKLADEQANEQAWVVFQVQHPTAFLSNLARQQIGRLRLAEPPRPLLERKPTEEEKVWGDISDSTDAANFRAFINQYPSSALAEIARLHAEAIDRIEAQTREQEAARQKRQATLEVAVRQAEESARRRVEQEAALERARAEVKAAEEARLDAEREAALKREVEERQRQIAERARLEQQAYADAARQQAEQNVAIERARAEAKAAEEHRLKVEHEAALKREEEIRQTAVVEAALAQQESVCRDERARLSSLQAAGSKARDELKKFEQELNCRELRPLVIAALDRADAVPAANTPELVRSAQQELSRLGCFSGAADGSLNASTATAVQRYQTERGDKLSSDVAITDDFVSQLKKQSARVCPLACPAGKTVEGERCVAVAAKTSPAKQEKLPSHREPPPRVAQPAPNNGGGRGGVTIGVGF